ncbi:MAG: HlyD family type I secretion periplasmic adaptor subunit [Betaproteobacteria bacterium]|nr:HlyD family type I secretion periplasmic adaptor subunit [Betaproteobacteria bacterium]
MGQKVKPAETTANPAPDAGFAQRTWLERLNPFARTADATDPYKLYTIEEDERLARDFVADADSAIISQDPLRARKAIRSVFAVCVILIVWASIANVDEITRGDGKVIPSKQLQVIQSLDGGIISQILVKEGQTVREGQVLLKIDATRFISGYRESRTTYLALLAKAARLTAVAEGTPFVPPKEVAAEEPLLAQQEQLLYSNRKAELESQITMARVQLQQRNQELVEARARNESASQGLEFTSKELRLTKPLVESGAVSDVDLLRLQRDVSRYSGEKAQTAAQIGRLQAAISEAQTKIQNVELEFRNQARTELAETQAKINSLGESSVALSDKVKQADIKSPMNGTIKRLLFNTVGGVVPPGKDIVEIVPLEDTLLLEARVNPRDIAFLRPGQNAKVKFTAYDFAIYGSLDGALEHIGADSLVDDKGNAYYLVRVRTTKSSLGKGLPIIPGMVAEVDILTGKKSVLSYLLKPVLRAQQYALTER